MAISKAASPTPSPQPVGPLPVALCLTSQPRQLQEKEVDETKGEKAMEETPLSQEPQPNLVAHKTLGQSQEMELTVADGQLPIISVTLATTIRSSQSMALGSQTPQSSQEPPQGSQGSAHMSGLVASQPPANDSDLDALSPIPSLHASSLPRPSLASTGQTSPSQSPESKRSRTASPVDGDGEKNGTLNLLDSAFSLPLDSPDFRPKKGRASLGRVLEGVLNGSPRVSAGRSDEGGQEKLNISIAERMESSMTEIRARLSSTSVGGPNSVAPSLSELTGIMDVSSIPPPAHSDSEPTSEPPTTPVRDEAADKTLEDATPKRFSLSQSFQKRASKYASPLKCPSIRKSLAGELAEQEAELRGVPEVLLDTVVFQLPPEFEQLLEVAEEGELLTARVAEFQRELLLSSIDNLRTATALSRATVDTMCAEGDKEEPDFVAAIRDFRISKLETEEAHLMLGSRATVESQLLQFKADAAKVLREEIAETLLDEVEELETRKDGKMAAEAALVGLRAELESLGSEEERRLLRSGTAAELAREWAASRQDSESRGSQVTAARRQMHELRLERSAARQEWALGLAKASQRRTEDLRRSGRLVQSVTEEKREEEAEANALESLGRELGWRELCIRDGCLRGVCWAVRLEVSWSSTGVMSSPVLAPSTSVLETEYGESDKERLIGPLLASALKCQPGLSSESLLLKHRKRDLPGLLREVTTEVGKLRAVYSELHSVFEETVGPAFFRLSGSRLQLHFWAAKPEVHFTSSFFSSSHSPK